jgi:hypothetical protein
MIDAFRLTLVAAALVALCGCERSIFSERYHSAGATPLVDTSFEVFTDSRLAEMIEPARLPAPPPAPPAAPPNLDTAIKDFYNAYADTTRSQPRDTYFYVRRNQIQDALLAASEQRCSSYKEYLRHLDSLESLTAGGLATIFGGVGAIVTGAAASRLFAGLAGISSGLNAELKQDIFSNLASAVIVPGIEVRRSQILADIMKRRCNSVATYTVQLAIADALKFHGACSMDTGIQQASKSVQQTKDPGLSELADSLKRLRSLQTPVTAASPSATGTTTTQVQRSNGTTTKTVKSTVSEPTDGAQPESAPPHQTTASIEGVEIPVDCGGIWSPAAIPPSPGAPRFRAPAPAAP